MNRKCCLFLSFFLFFSTVLTSCSYSEENSLSTANSISVSSSSQTEIPEEIPYFQYGRSLLPEKHQEIYDQLFQAASRFDLAQNIPIHDIFSGDELDQFIRTFQDDNPRYYWAVPTLESGGLQLTLADNLDLETVMQRDQEILTVVDELLQDLPEDKVLQVYTLHDRLAKRIAYSKSDSYSASDLYGGLVQGRALCQGYAKTFQFLMQQIDISTIYLFGQTVSSELHAWNAVLLENSWYYVDLTYADITSPSNHYYLGMTYEESSRERIWDTTQYREIPQDRETTCNYFVYKNYAISSDCRDVDQLADIFTRQLVERANNDNTPDWKFLELKVIGPLEEYESCKAWFMNSSFDILNQIKPQLQEQRPQLAFDTEEGIYCNYYNTYQILTFTPYVLRSDWIPLED